MRLVSLLSEVWPMFNRLFTHPISLSLTLSAIAFLGLLTPAFLNRQPPTATTEDFTLIESARAIAIDPVTQAITLEAIDSQ